MAFGSRHTRRCALAAAVLTALAAASPAYAADTPSTLLKQRPARARAATRHTARHRAPRPQPRSRTVAIAPRAFSGSGFDACSAPSLDAMQTWLYTSGYQAVGVYIGGTNRSCDDGNLTRQWVREAAAMGWNLVPVYVGPQAPCSRRQELDQIDPDDPQTQAEQDAADAAGRAEALDMAPGSAIYFDLEAYRRGDPECVGAVLAYLGTWIKTLHRYGYLAGVYASADSGIADIAEAESDYPGWGPDAVWIARWDGEPSTWDPALPDDLLDGRRRIKQFAGGHRETHGGVTLNIDSDWFDGPVAVVG